MALSRSLLARFSFASAMRAGRVSGDPLAPPRHCSDYTDISISRPLQGFPKSANVGGGVKRWKTAMFPPFGSAGSFACGHRPPLWHVHGAIQGDRLRPVQSSAVYVAVSQEPQLV